MARPKTANKPVVDKAFARRLEEACNLADHVPEYNFGRLRFVGDELEKRGVKASKESVRKWFAGEARPRPPKMKVLAQILKVDEAWLSLGIKPSMVSTREHSANVDGSVNLVAGLLSMNGVTCGWANGKDNVHFHAIIEGKSHGVFVAMANESKTGMKFTLPIDVEDRLIIGVIKRGPLDYDLYRIPQNMVSKSALKKGGFLELTAADNGDILLAAGNRAPKLNDLATLGH